ncbi:hypothetical protein R69658_07851 [Paraburkholderia aspalathi]|uniref:ISXO2-like transposase domain-containing protein n=1 Tax=Paraburkholderia aspalathi TaxID=1324617 RepID=A0ABM8T7N5_9BURK|nr:hypothetical protein R69658_07851 [Paraburkholderia aspalathi]
MIFSAVNSKIRRSQCVLRKSYHYLDEFVFRFNRRTSRSRGQLFYRLLEQAVAAEPVTYRQIAQRPPKASALP